LRVKDDLLDFGSLCSLLTLRHLRFLTARLEVFLAPRERQEKRIFFPAYDFPLFSPHILSRCAHTPRTTNDAPTCLVLLLVKLPRTMSCSSVSNRIDRTSCTAIQLPFDPTLLIQLLRQRIHGYLITTCSYKYQHFALSLVFQLGESRCLSRCLVRSGIYMCGLHDKTRR
jgi:hypothetical protein